MAAEPSRAGKVSRLEFRTPNPKSVRNWLYTIHPAGRRGVSMPQKPLSKEEPIIPD